MLESLHIRNFVLINSLDIAFPEGLVIISGPTGAGKSILLGALGLLLGRKADASVISEDAENCVVEGEFSSNSRTLKDLALENDLEYEEGHFTIRRQVARSGRSRAFINDTPVTLSVLEEFGAALVDIHSQHDTRLLTNRAYQLSILDSFASNQSLLQQCAETYGAMKQKQAEVEKLRQAISRSSAELDYNKAVYDQLCAASLRPSELEELEQEQLQLANSQQIKELLASSAMLFDGDQSSDGVNSTLSQIHRNLEKLGSYLKGFDSLAQRLESARLEIKDISMEIESADQGLDCSEERLQAIDDRISLLYQLIRRHGVSSVEELIEKRDSLKDQVQGPEEMQEQLQELEAQYNTLSVRYAEISQELHQRRTQASADFRKEILGNLSFMELERAAFEVEIVESAASATGTDAVNFLFNATGGTAVPVAKCASGGELSRIMLSLKQLMSRFMSMPTMIFDEIDTGVSGSVADKMGQVICTMGGNMQVFAITHLPQVAAKGCAHYLVEKSTDSLFGTTTSTIKKLSEDQRVLEIARMLSGSSLSQAAIENAKALLNSIS